MWHYGEHSKHAILVYGSISQCPTFECNYLCYILSMVFHCDVLSFILMCVILYVIIFYLFVFSVLHCIVLYCIVLYCIVLYWNV